MLLLLLLLVPSLLLLLLVHRCHGPLSAATIACLLSVDAGDDPNIDEPPTAEVVGMGGGGSFGGMPTCAWELQPPRPATGVSRALRARSVSGVSLGGCLSLTTHTPLIKGVHFHPLS